MIKLNEEIEVQEIDDTSQEPELEITEDTTSEPTELTQEVDETTREQENVDENESEETNEVESTETTIETTGNEAQVVVPVDTREMTVFDTDNGTINVIHELTVGDLLISTALFILIVFMLIDRVIRR